MMRTIAAIIILLSSFLSISVYAREDGPSKLVAVYNKDFPPFSYEDQQNEPAGFAIEIMKAIEFSTGIQVEYRPVSETELLQQLETDGIDVILGLKYSSSHDAQVDFTSPILTMSHSLYVPAENNTVFNLPDLRNAVVSISSSSYSREAFDAIREVNVNIAGSQPDALRMLLVGRSDAFIGNPWTTEFLLKEMDERARLDERLIALQPYEYAFAVRNGNYELTNVLNNELAAMKMDGTFQELYQKWFYEEESAVSWLQKLALFLGAAVLVTMAIITVVFFWNQKLQKEVAKKTTALTRSLLFQEQVLRSVDTGIISFHKTGKIRLMNEKARSLLKVAFTEQHMNEVPDLAGIWEIIQEDPSRPRYSGGMNLVTEEKEERTIDYEVVPLKNEKSRFVGWIMTMDDITDELSLQKKLIVQEKLKALGQLVAGIAHELRNPLTSMKLFIELLPVKIHDARFREEVVRHVPAEIKRLNDLVEDLLDYTRRKEPIKEWIPLAGFLDSLIHSFQIKVQSQHIAFIVTVDPDLELFGDVHRMKQVFINLVMNAIEAVQDSNEKVITISAESRDAFFYVHVHDTGAGISPEHQSNLFEPFFTTKGSGVGLGLYTSYNILLDHHGDIEVKSAAGAGSTFTLKFQKEDVR
jgi:signal transduction histidine kinase/ABC-type amino acid transport substrate-binding protein